MSVENESTATESTSTEATVDTGVESGQGSSESQVEVPENETNANEAGTEGAGGAEGKGTPGEKGAAYKSNFKFKADDKEHEIPEYLRGAIKDEKTEKEMVDLLQKAYGLDSVKTRAETTRQQRDEFKTKLGDYDKAIDRLRSHYGRGDIDQWLTEMKVDPNKMLKWALDKVNYSQLPPEQKAIRDAEMNASRRAFELEQENVQLQSQNRESTVHAMQTALNYELGRPDVSEFQNAFDQKAGRPGAFFEAVKQKGQSAYTLSGGSNTMTPTEAVAAVMKDYAGFLPARGSQQANPNAPKVVQPNPGGKSTIPNVAGKQSSPVGPTKPKNLKELREMAAKANS